MKNKVSRLMSSLHRSYMTLLPRTREVTLTELTQLIFVKRPLFQVIWQFCVITRILEINTSPILTLFFQP